MTAESGSDPIDRKFTTEFGFHVRAIQLVVVQQQDLSRLSEEAWATKIQPSHVYLICRRPKISLVAAETTFDADVVTGKFRVWRGHSYEEVPFAVPNYMDTPNLTVRADYPGTYFEVCDGSGDKLLWGNSAMLMGSFGSEFYAYLDLEVLYVGQSFGFEGSRTAQDRLQSHSTLQAIHAEALNRSPDMDVWLVLIAFEDPYILTAIDPTKQVQTTDAEDDAHIDQVLSTPISVQQEVNLTEAMLIRYFDAPYNKMFRNSFPNPAHATYSECYDLDFNSVSVEVETSDIGSRLWSAAVLPSWLHLPRFPLHQHSERAAMFGIFD